MGTGIGASITSLTNGTTANAPDVMASLNSLNTNGVSNDSGVITTDGSGHITAANGLLRTVLLVTPFTAINNATINSGNTNTPTLTGGSTGVPSGAKAILINTFFTPGTAGMSVLYTPHGTAWSAGNYPALWVTSDTTHIVGGSFFVIVDVNGQLDVKANGGNAVGIYVVINGYLL